MGNIVVDNLMTKNFVGNALDDGVNSWDDGLVGNRYGDFDEPGEG
ncbi:hypothetical protein [Candidatus Methanocrinis natronophilus]|uniref:Uncharacterized protein n=1 Tax=Candidatus Methanocrinis natronophilus TaxID=3033396 RepID=A0ABT5XB28_9EURY|nr:hypothetical protein [Candidatus Methanocrinis natronophilus]MDF0591861.1 hypothetical protein [Candidatus Methanocrinis natronophilus]